jgi:hypothetical protein
MINLYSVDIVLTSDKSKWTRCIVLEACDVRSNLSEMHGDSNHENLNLLEKMDNLMVPVPEWDGSPICN